MKYGILIAAGLLLCGCDNNGDYAKLVCRERDVVSGTCTKGEYICYAPQVLKTDSKSRPACYMPDTRS
jgi:hypothetical protein